jgi:diacylglycerol kinase family enzyme
LDTAEAIKLINQKNVVTIDAGAINNKPFFCTAGVGFDAHIGKVFSERSVRGFGSYIKLTLKEFRNYRPRTYIIETGDGSTKLQAFTITVANAAQYGNEAYISPNADLQDGKLDLCILRPFPKFVALDLGLRLFTKTIHKSRYMRIIPINTARITTTDVDCLHLDGEPERLEKQTLSVKVLPACLNVLAPIQKQ